MTRRRFYRPAASIAIILSQILYVQAALAGTDKIYAIATLSVDASKSNAFAEHISAEQTIEKKHGVELLASYSVQFGEDVSRQINIWSAPDAEILRRGLAAPEMYTAGLRDMVLSETIEIAEKNPIPPLNNQGDQLAVPKIYAVVPVTIDPAKQAEFVQQVIAERALQARHGVQFIASYHIQLGDTASELDIWGAADAETIRQSFFAPDAAVAGFDGVIRKEGSQIATLNQTTSSMK